MNVEPTVPKLGPALGTGGGDPDIAGRGNKYDREGSTDGAAYEPCRRGRRDVPRRAARSLSPVQRRRHGQRLDAVTRHLRVTMDPRCDSGSSAQIRGGREAAQAVCDEEQNLA